MFHFFLLVIWKTKTEIAICRQKTFFTVSTLKDSYPAKQAFPL